MLATNLKKKLIELSYCRSCMSRLPGMVTIYEVSRGLALRDSLTEQLKAPQYTLDNICDEYEALPLHFKWEDKLGERTWIQGST